MRRWWLVLVLLLVGCGRPAPSAGGDSEGLFPHADDYVEGDHGVDWKADPASCTTCHDPTGATEQVGPACTTCHASYPHDDTFAAGAAHGPRWLSDPGPCVDCHGEQGTEAPAGASPGACTGCHSTFPHPEGFTSPDEHGAAVLAHGGTEACQGCHGIDYQAYPSGECSTCHATYPHGSGWIGEHGQAFLAGSSCDDCHGAPEVDGVTACAQCHATFPHPDGWTQGHIPPVQAQGDAACVQCHPAGSFDDAPTIPQAASCAPGCHAPEGAP